MHTPWHFFFICLAFLFTHNSIGDWLFDDDIFFYSSSSSSSFSFFSWVLWSRLICLFVCWYCCCSKSNMVQPFDLEPFEIYGRSVSQKKLPNNLLIWYFYVTWDSHYAIPQSISKLLGSRKLFSFEISFLGNCLTKFVSNWISLRGKNKEGNNGYLQVLGLMVISMVSYHLRWDHQ